MKGLKKKKKHLRCKGKAMNSIPRLAHIGCSYALSSSEILGPALQHSEHSLVHSQSDKITTAKWTHHHESLQPLRNTQCVWVPVIRNNSHKELNFCSRQQTTAHTLGTCPHQVQARTYLWWTVCRSHQKKRNNIEKYSYSYILNWCFIPFWNVCLALATSSSRHYAGMGWGEHVMPRFDSGHPACKACA